MQAQPKKYSALTESAEYQALLTALREIDNSDAASRAFNETYRDQYREIWRNKNGGLERVESGRTCIHRLTRTKPHCCGHDDDCRPPGDDHHSIWSWQGKPVLYVYQPYGLSGEKTAALVRYCEKMGLAFRINALLAWHNPGDVLLIELWRKDFDRWQLPNLYKTSTT
jgi:hypothetical protein